jgi:hypothetical protein
MNQHIHERLIAWLALAVIALLLADAVGTVMLARAHKSERDALITSDICRSTPVSSSAQYSAPLPQPP